MKAQSGMLGKNSSLGWTAGDFYMAYEYIQGVPLLLLLVFTQQSCQYLTLRVYSTGVKRMSI